MNRSWKKLKPKSALGAASWGSLAFAALTGAIATVELGSQPASFTGAAMIPAALEAQDAVSVQEPAPTASAVAPRSSRSPRRALRKCRWSRWEA